MLYRFGWIEFFFHLFFGIRNVEIKRTWTKGLLLNGDNFLFVIVFGIKIFCTEKYFVTINSLVSGDLTYSGFWTNQHQKGQLKWKFSLEPSVVVTICNFILHICNIACLTFYFKVRPITNRWYSYQCVDRGWVLSQGVIWSWI